MRHRFRWYVVVGDEMLPHTAHMRGAWPGWYVRCSCGWEPKGHRGEIRARIREYAFDHLAGHGIVRANLLVH